jgi:hypothetical protein
MKKGFTLFLVLAFCSFEAFCITLPPSIGHYRWKDDSGNESSTNWLAPEKDSVFKKGESNIRLRMEITTNGQDYSKSTGLYYKVTGDTIDTLMHLISNDESNAFTFSLSTFIIDGEPTTQQLTITGTETNVAGFVKENPGFFNFSINDGERKELEFCIKPSPNADYNNKMYSFILAGEDSLGFFYISSPEFDSLMPTIILQKTKLTVTADNLSKEVGTANPEFTVSYSGFVDGDDESVLDKLPKIITTATTDSPIGDYDVVPYDAEDNKYEFEYVNGTLTVHIPSETNNIETDQLSIYPNPAGNYIYLAGKIPSNAIVKVYDLTGKGLLEQQISQEIDISPLSHGCYILKINDSVYRFTKQ